MPGNIGPLEIIVVLIIALFVFGPNGCRSSATASATVSASSKIRSRASKDDDDDDDEGQRVDATATPASLRPTHRARTRSSPTKKLRPGRDAAPRPAVSHEDHLTLVEHLDELRNRLVVCLVVFGVALALCFWQNHLLLEIASGPLPSGHKKLITFGVTEPFTTTLTVSAYGGRHAGRCRSSLPALCLRPARLHPSREAGGAADLAALPDPLRRRVAFAYFVVMPAALHFLLGFNNNQFNIQVRARDYYSFFSTTMLAGGLVFQMPMVILAVTRLGIVKIDQLNSTAATRTW